MATVVGRPFANRSATAGTVEVELEKFAAEQNWLAADLNPDDGLYLARKCNALPAAPSRRVANAPISAITATVASAFTAASSANIKVTAQTIKVCLVRHERNRIANPAQ